MKFHLAQPKTLVITSVLILILTLLLTACSENTATVVAATTSQGAASSTPKPEPNPTTKIITVSTATTPNVGTTPTVRVSKDCLNLFVDYRDALKVFYDNRGKAGCMAGKINVQTKLKGEILLKLSYYSPPGAITPTEVEFQLVIPKDKITNFDQIALTKLEGKAIEAKGVLEIRSDYLPVRYVIIVERPDQIQEITNP